MTAWQNDRAEADQAEWAKWANEQRKINRSQIVGRFELRKDEETGRMYWWGAEDGWKDATEIGEDGVLTLSAEHFAVGTIIELSEPEDGRA
jgi:hypothetical protein